MSSGDANPLKLCINSLVSAMKADYGHLFKSQFSSNEDIIMYQSRLYSKLEGAGYTKRVLWITAVNTLLQSQS